MKICSGNNMDWLKHGDRNTKYFYAYTNRRQRANQISRIKDERGCECESQEEIGQVFINYYNNLFTSEASCGMEACLGNTER